VLGDASSLAGHNVGAADCIQELGLTVVDVTHDGHHRRTNNEVFLVLFLIEIDIETLEKFLVLVFRRDNLDLVTKLRSEDLEGGRIQRLGRSGHFTELEQHGDQVPRRNVEARHYFNFLGEIADRRTLAKPDDGRTIAPGNLHTAEAWRLPHFKLLTLRPLRLAGLVLAATAPKRTSGTTTGAAATTASTGTTTRTTGAAGASGTTRTTTGSAGTWPTKSCATRAAGATGALLEGCASTSATVIGPASADAFTGSRCTGTGHALS
jgi:hypothetical protein